MIVYQIPFTFYPCIEGFDIGAEFEMRCTADFTPGTPPEYGYGGRMPDPGSDPCVENYRDIEIHVTKRRLASEADKTADKADFDAALVGMDGDFVEAELARYIPPRFILEEKWIPAPAWLVTLLFNDDNKAVIEKIDEAAFEKVSHE